MLQGLEIFFSRGQFHLPGPQRLLAFGDPPGAQPGRGKSDQPLPVERGEAAHRPGKAQARRLPGQGAGEFQPAQKEGEDLGEGFSLRPRGHARGVQDQAPAGTISLEPAAGQGAAGDLFRRVFFQLLHGGAHAGAGQVLSEYLEDRVARRHSPSPA